MVDVESYVVGEEQEPLYLSHFFLDYSTSFEHFAHVHHAHVPETCMFAGSSSTEHLCSDHSASTLVVPELEEDDFTSACNDYKNVFAELGIGLGNSGSKERTDILS